MLYIHIYISTLWKNLRTYMCTILNAFPLDGSFALLHTATPWSYHTIITFFTTENCIVPNGNSTWTRLEWKAWGHQSQDLLEIDILLSQLSRRDCWWTKWPNKNMRRLWKNGIYMDNLRGNKTVYWFKWLPMKMVVFVANLSTANRQYLFECLQL